MAAIPWWAYLGSGIAISIMSKIVEKNSKPGSFALFFWIGILFIVVGVGKLVFKYVLRREKNASINAQNMQHAQPARHPAHHPLSQHAPPSGIRMHHFQGQHQVSKATNQQVRIQESSIIVPCPACGTKHYNYANFCMRCGTKIKR
jgi:ABC-type nickel/cobalt efflux system permease component RcnA